MFRAIAYLIASVLVISIVRSIIGDHCERILPICFNRPVTKPPPGSGPRALPSPAGGELKKDPVCGTFISTATALQKRSGGEVYYFCSTECRDKFKG